MNAKETVKSIWNFSHSPEVIKKTIQSDIMRTSGVAVSLNDGIPEDDSKAWDAFVDPVVEKKEQINFRNLQLETLEVKLYARKNQCWNRILELQDQLAQVLPSQESATVLSSHSHLKSLRDHYLSQEDISEDELKVQEATEELIEKMHLFDRYNRTLGKLYVRLS